MEEHQLIVVYTVHLYAAESVVFALRRLDTGYFVHHHDRGLFWRVLVSGVLATGYGSLGLGFICWVCGDGLRIYPAPLSTKLSKQCVELITPKEGLDFLEF